MTRDQRIFAWLRGAAYFAVFGTGISVAVEGRGQVFPALIVLLVYTATVPLFSLGWKRRLEVGNLLLTIGSALALFEGYLSHSTTSVLVLVMILYPNVPRLPRLWQILWFGLWPVEVIVSWHFLTTGILNWWDALGLVTGLVALSLFVQAFWRMRVTALENQHMLDQLVEAQRKLAGEAERSDSVEELPEAALLTRRDREVLSLVAKGFSNKEIADQLFIAEGTVKNRVSLILDKIGARDRTQAALRARDLGVL